MPRRRRASGWPPTGVGAPVPECVEEAVCFVFAPRVALGFPDWDSVFFVAFAVVHVGCAVVEAGEVVFFLDWRLHGDFGLCLGTAIDLEGLFVFYNFTIHHTET